LQQRIANGCPLVRILSIMRAPPLLASACGFARGNVPDIGLVCLKEVRQATQADLPSHEGGRMMGDNESGWIDARRKKPSAPAEGARAAAYDEGYKIGAGQKAVCLGHRAVGRIAVGILGEAVFARSDQDY
jgi:hypothetical protein